MPMIHLVTEINAPIERCFDLSFSIDFHRASTSKTGEKAVEGVTSGLIGLDQTVTWRATHLGVRQQLTVKITEVNRPYYFKDEMLKGAFKAFSHAHYFNEKGPITVMTDQFQYDSPCGLLGKIADVLFLERYMAAFLKERNRMLKHAAETEEWKNYL